jgi:hypothetical protein
MRNGFGSKHVNIPTSNLTAEFHLAGGHFLLKEQTLNKDISQIYLAGTRRPTVSKREGQNLEQR